MATDKELMVEMWGAFDVLCKECGSHDVVIDNSFGWSCPSGAWGDVSIVCRDCKNDHIIMDS